MTADLFPWIIAALSFLALVAALLSASRTQRHLRAIHDESVAAKDEQISTLEMQVGSLRESESIRFVERYLAAKNGLQERQDRLHTRLEALRDAQSEAESELTDLSLSDRERETEAHRLRDDLLKATEQVQRLEAVLREVATVGDMDVKAIRGALAERRELSAHIKERLDRLSLEHQDRVASRRMREEKLGQLEEEAGRIRREIEITRAAGAMVDAIMGIDRDTRKRLARHASDRIEGALQSLGDASQRSPVSWFVDILEERPDRLLEQGTTESSPSRTDEDRPSPTAERARDEAARPNGPEPMTGSRNPTESRPATTP